MFTPYPRFIVSDEFGDVIRKFWTLEDAQTFVGLDYHLQLTVVPLPDPTCYLGDEEPPF